MKLVTSAGWVAAGVLGIVAATGVAQAATTNGPTPGPSTAGATATAQPTSGSTPAKAHKHALGHLEHGTLTMKTKDGSREVLVQRGEITAVGAASVTVKSADGYTVSWKTDAATKVTRNKAKVSSTDLAVGDKVSVRGPGTQQDATATVIRSPKKAA